MQTPLGQVVAISDGIDSQDDVDVYAVDVAAGQRLVADINARVTGTSALDSYLRLFDGDGNQLAFNDDSNYQQDSFLAFRPDVTGRYYIGVSSFPNVAYDPRAAGGGSGDTIGFYSLRILATSDTVGDTLATALSMNLVPGDAATVAGSLEIADDADLYRVDLSSGEALSASLSNMASVSGTSSLYVFDVNGQQLAYNDDSARSSTVTFQAPETGPYFIGVSAFGAYDPLTFGKYSSDFVLSQEAPGPYQLRLEVVPPELVGNTIATAPRLTLTPWHANVQSDAIEAANDVDFFALDLAAEYQLTAQINSGETTGTLDSHLRLFDENGVEVGSSIDVHGSGPLLDLSVPATGRYYLGVSANPNTSYDPSVAGNGSGDSIGAYNLVLREMPPPPPDVTG